ncbi:hypothetical protein PS001_24660, partial [Shigella sonnei]|nr:hypothetical protein [Shigella sonnei]
TDNGAQFTDRKLGQFLEKCGVKLKFASVHHPKRNGQAEAANKLVLNLLKKKLTGAKGKWADELPAVLWALRTTPSRATGETPFR